MRETRRTASKEKSEVVKATQGKTAKKTVRFEEPTKTLNL